MTTELIITTYNRPEYLKQCLESLTKLTEFPNLVLVIDDASDDTKVLQLLKQINEPLPIKLKVYVKAIFKEERKGIKDSLRQGFDMAFAKGVDLAINLDSDAIVKPDFITRLKDLKARYPDHIVSGFNCNNPRNPVIYEGEDYVMRKHCNGINMAIDARQYENIILPALKGKSNWDYDSTHNLPFVIAKPSVVNHLAPNDSTMGHKGGDIACDF